MDSMGPGIADAITWLIERRAKGELPRWIIRALAVPVLAGMIGGFVLGWGKGDATAGIVVGILFGFIGFLLTYGVLRLYVGGHRAQHDWRGYTKRQTIRSMSNEQLLRIWTSGCSQEWTEDDLDVIEETLKARGLALPERK